MKRIVSVFVIISILLITFSACEKGEGVPFVTTKSATTAAPNTVTVTFPEGFTVTQIAERLAENGVCSSTEFLEACKTVPEGIEIPNIENRVFALEGYLFPDTYEFYLNSDVTSVINRFIENLNNKLDKDILFQVEDSGYTVDEILTLASMIQRECDEDISECANVSSVFHNRLNRSDFSMLQSDPTTFYITDVLGERLGYEKNVPLEQQNEEVQKYMNLYSTYYCQGLPVGPICNPGMKAIRAALNPADTDYVYFLTDATGKEFYYASTIAEHNANGKKAGLF